MPRRSRPGAPVRILSGRTCRSGQNMEARGSASLPQDGLPLNTKAWKVEKSW